VEADVAVVSAASVWEVSTKMRLGKLRPPSEELLEELEEWSFDLLAITARHAWVAGGLPPHHRDPFDRILVAQAQLEGLTIVTRDPAIARYQVAVLAA
jgi:PIN domain nuclease of toxin-antitoxin system